jgi:O-acetyl-ADP-ribose deacetylase (regulator of RNase III)
MLLFIEFRAHYHQGGGWGDHDPLMDKMRRTAAAIRARVNGRGGGVGLWRGDITRLDVDVIVNAANRALSGGGGVDGAIQKAAGPELLEACLALPEVAPAVRCPVGSARLTPGFDLHAGHVVHAVGPVWHGGARGEAAALDSAYRASLALAATAGAESVAFPAISTGAYGYPAHEAAQVAVTAYRAWLAETDLPMRILLVAFDARGLRALTRALAAW